MKPNESEADSVGTQFLAEYDPDTDTDYVLIHGGDVWRPPWTY